MGMLAVAASLSLMLAGSVAEAGDRFVSKTGNDSGNDCGSAGAPCQTIAHALAVASSGDVIKVARGTYGESLLIDGNGTRTLEGGWNRSFGARDVAATPTILRRRSGERVLRISAGSGISNTTTLDGFTITRAFVAQGLGGGILAESADTGSLTLSLVRVTMSQNHAQGGGALGLESSGGSTMQVDVSGSTFRRNGGKGSLPDGGGGAIRADSSGTSVLTLNIADTTFDKNASGRRLGGAILTFQVSSGTITQTYTRVTFTKNSGNSGGGLLALNFSPNHTLTLTNCVFVGNHATDRGGAVDLEGPYTVSVTNSTFTRNSARFGGGGGLAFIGPISGTSTGTIKNTIVRGNAAPFGDDIEFGGDVTVTARFSNIGEVVHGPFSGGTFVDGGGNVDVDPLFINATAGDVHLRAGSPMIDAGICHADDPAIPIDDFEGTPRPNPLGPDPAKCDIGADEF